MDLNKQDLRGLRRDAARRQAGGDADTSVLVSLDDIVIDETIQPRQAGVDAGRAQQYATAMVEYGGWGQFPPVVVFRDPATNVLRLAGGFTRRVAVDLARQTLLQDGKPPIEVIPCEIRVGGYREAVEFAEDDNLQHGMDLTSRDKRAIYFRRMTEGHIWAEYSNRRVAAELGVDEGTIRNWHRKLTAENSAVGQSDTRTGRDGRTINVGGIQKAHRGQGDRPARQRYVDGAEFDQTAAYDEPSVDLDEPVGTWSDEPPAQPRGAGDAGVSFGTPGEDNRAVEHLSDKLSEWVGASIRLKGALVEILHSDWMVLPDGVLDQVNEALVYLNSQQDQTGRVVLGVFDLLIGVYERYTGQEWEDA